MYWCTSRYSYTRCRTFPLSTPSFSSHSKLHNAFSSQPSRLVRYSRGEDMMLLDNYLGVSFGVDESYCDIILMWSALEIHIVLNSGVGRPMRSYDDGYECPRFFHTQLAGREILDITNPSMYCKVLSIIWTVCKKRSGSSIRSILNVAGRHPKDGFCRKLQFLSTHTKNVMINRQNIPKTRTRWTRNQI